MGGRGFSAREWPWTRRRPVLCVDPPRADQARAGRRPEPLPTGGARRAPGGL